MNNLNKLNNMNKLNNLNKLILIKNYCNLLFLFLNRTPNPNKIAKATINIAPDSKGIKVNSVD